MSWIKCDLCDGVGYDVEENACFNCNGEGGHRTAPELPCYVCDGFGTWADGQKCPNCSGTGYDVETERIWKEVIEERRKQNKHSEEGFI